MDHLLSERTRVHLCQPFLRVRHEAPNLPGQVTVILLLFCIVVLCGSVLEMIVATPFPATVLVHLYLTTVTTLLALCWCRFIEKRSLRSMGLTGRHFLRDYLAGALAGFAMLGGAVLLGLLTGAYTVRHGQTTAAYAVLIAVGWMLQGFSEEICFRGYLMMSLGGRANPVPSVTASAVMFASAHLGNNGISPVAVLNLFLFGIVAGVLVLRTDSIWSAAAMHSVWNWTQGNVFGLPVSGLDADKSFLYTEGTGRLGWFTGGTFGAEGGIAITLILTAALLLLLFVPVRQKTDTPQPERAAAKPE